MLSLNWNLWLDVFLRFFLPRCLQMQLPGGGEHSARKVGRLHAENRLLEARDLWEEEGLGSRLRRRFWIHLWMVAKSVRT